MKADAVEDCDWLAIDTELRFAPAEPCAVEVEEEPAESAAPRTTIFVSKVELSAAVMLASDPIPLTVTWLSEYLAEPPDARA